MHFFIVLLAFNAALWSAVEPLTPSRPIQVNARVEPAEIALNQPVRFEFSTLPRQIDGVDIATVVTSTLALAGSDDWRLISRPTINEQDSKSKIIKVTVTMLPRRAGIRVIPDIPITWLQGNYIAHVEPVRVLERLLVAGTMRDIPKEATGVADWKWGMDFSDAEKRVGPEQVSRIGDRMVIAANEGLTLEFMNGHLGQAHMTIAELNLESGRIDFIKRWGLPIDEDQGRLRWIIGWTLITASAGDNGKGTALLLQREDALNEVARSTVKSKVFDILDRQ